MCLASNAEKTAFSGHAAEGEKRGGLDTQISAQERKQREKFLNRGMFDIFLLKNGAPVVPELKCSCQLQPVSRATQKHPFFRLTMQGRSSTLSLIHI